MNSLQLGSSNKTTLVVALLRVLGRLVSDTKSSLAQNQQNTGKYEPARQHRIQILSNAKLLLIEQSKKSIMLSSKYFNKDLVRY